MENLTRRSLLLGMSTAIVASPFMTPAEAFGADSNASDGSTAFIGGYTDQGSKSLGIYSYRWDSQKGELTPMGLAAATQNPSFLAISSDKSTLYAANEISSFRGAKDGALSAFAADLHSGKLTVKSVVSSDGEGPAHISLDHTNRSIFCANYGAGSVASFKALPISGMGEAVSHFQYTGHGPDPKRQAAPHAHCVTVTPDNGYLLVNDLGLDKIHIYKLDAANAVLTAHVPAAYEALPKSGPRSFVFHPGGKYAYSTNELSNTVDVLQWDATKGTLTRVQHIGSLKPGTKYTSETTVASVCVSADGRFVYVSNRGEDNDSLTAFSVDEATGKLTFVQMIPSGGKIPRHFAIDPSGKWIVVAHQKSNSLVVFARDPGTGMLSATGRSYAIDWPTCVLFA